MKVSVIIPCYNDGHFLDDAVSSVINCSYKNVEIIIVNDGSTDANTLKILKNFEDKGIKVISHINAGLGFTRNAGIKASSGKYIIPLDADNKLGFDYIKKAVKIMEKTDVDIVYAKPSFFGEDIPNRRFLTHEFDGEKLYLTNYIDTCAVFRKSVWEKIGGYDEKMPIAGNEDWEFWISSFINGFKFTFLDQELFSYRITGNSMISNIDSDKFEINHNYIVLKHKKAILNQIEHNRYFQKIYQNDQKNYLRTAFKYLIKFLKRQ